MEHVNLSYLTNMTRLIVGSIAYLADAEIEHPNIKIAAPKRGKLYFEDRDIFDYKFYKTVVVDDFLICTEVEPGIAAIDYVEFYYDGKLMYTDTDLPYQWRLNRHSIRKHNIEVIAYDTLGNTARDSMEIRYVNLFKFE